MSRAFFIQAFGCDGLFIAKGFIFRIFVFFVSLGLSEGIDFTSHAFSSRAFGCNSSNWMFVAEVFIAKILGVGEDIPVDGLEDVDPAVALGQEDTGSDCPKEEGNNMKNFSFFHDSLHLTRENISEVILLGIQPGMAVSALQHIDKQLYCTLLVT